jgi:hypothetical protein
MSQAEMLEMLRKDKPYAFAQAVRRRMQSRQRR